MSDLSDYWALRMAALQRDESCHLSREELLILAAMENGGSIWRAWRIGIEERDK